MKQASQDINFKNYFYDDDQVVDDDDGVAPDDDLHLLLLGSHHVKHWSQAESYHSTNIFSFNYQVSISR